LKDLLILSRMLLKYNLDKQSVSVDHIKFTVDRIKWLAFCVKKKEPVSSIITASFFTS
jgi:hypothetical protein